MYIHHMNLRDFAVDCLIGLGVSQDAAIITANSLVLADMRGIATHGVRRLPSYAERLRSCYYRAGGTFRVVDEFPAGYVVDGGHALGQVTADRAMNLAIDRADETGIACVAIRNGGHIGAHGNVVMKCVRARHFGFIVTSGRAALPAPGGIGSTVTSAPFALACPTRATYPLILDMALGIVARGHILRAITEGRDIPSDWATGADGKSTIDPHEAIKGAINAIGGYKGFGLAVMFGALGGLLARAATGTDIAVPGSEKSFDAGHFLFSIDIRKFMPIKDFAELIDRYMRQIKSTRMAEGTKDILLPGQRSTESWRNALNEGIKITDAVAPQYIRLGFECCVDFDTFLKRQPPFTDPALLPPEPLGID